MEERHRQAWRKGRELPDPHPPSGYTTLPAPPHAHCPRSSPDPLPLGFYGDFSTQA